MLGITMTRYIDPDWAVGVPSTTDDSPKALELDPERAWLIKLDTEALNDLGPLYNQIGKGFVSLGTSTSAEKILQFELKQVELDKKAKSSETRESLSCLSLCVYKHIIDGVDTTQKPIEIALIERSNIDAVYLLHQPLAAGRYVAKVLARPRKTNVANTDENIRQGLSNLPIVLASFEWSSPKEVNLGVRLPSISSIKSNLVIDSRMNPVAYQTNVSAPTYHKWTRTSRDFGYVHAAEINIKKDGWTLEALPVNELIGHVEKDQLTLTRGQSKEPLWLRPSTFNNGFPLYVHRNLAVITSNFLKELGKPTEKFVRSSSMVDKGVTLFPLSKSKVDFIDEAFRVIEYEIPALPLCNSDLEGVPNTYKSAKFDIFRSGFAPSESGGQLRFFFRFVGSFVRLKSLTEVTISLWPDMVKLNDKNEFKPGSEFKYEANLALASDKNSPVVGIFATVSQPKKIGVAEIAFELLTSEGSRVPITPAKKDLLFNLTEASPQNPGFCVEIKSNPGDELWTDVSLLHSASDKSLDAFDFDWLFSPTGELSPTESVKPFGLNKMVEAQARIVSVSTPIPIRNWT